ncbi:MAG TPA: hypothetical protein PLR20_01520 [Syntrophales bacterium]|nr:hypothetical protein [Syntrophales bacterium]HOX93580.1 hypothetical protein [Syntrophales bacterium]HPI56875.1 hypothetical protein [Syntrophales bacterium]HPN23461.1 hypothetical protein [Syntrophales bacterium]HQM28014.1 hypothetical protein [Syntrophales bacterium]
MNGRLFEIVDFHCEVFPNTSGNLDPVTRWVDVTKYDRVAVLANTGSAISSANAEAPIMTILQAATNSAWGSSLSSALANSSAKLFSTIATAIRGQVLEIAPAANATHADALIFNGLTFTYSTDESTAAVSSARTFNSTIGSSAEGGPQLICQHLATMINNSTFGVPGARAATFSTGACRVYIDGSKSSVRELDLQTTANAGTNWGAKCQTAQAIVEFDVGQLAAGNKYIAVRLTTESTTVPVNVNIIGYRKRYSPTFDSTAASTSFFKVPAA